MNSHEAAPAAALAATICALCGRPLVDAESVELGVGPVCRGKYGWDDGPDTARAEANRLVWQIAAAPAANDVPAKVSQIRALGYLRLADRLTERLVPDLGAIRITTEGDRLVIETEGLSREAFDALLAVLRSVPGRRWDRDRKLNTVPVAQKRALWDGIRTMLPAGIVIRSERGEHRL